MSIASLVPALDLSLTLHLGGEPSDSAGLRALTTLLMAGGAVDVALARLVAYLDRHPEDGEVWVDRARTVVAEAGLAQAGGLEPDGTDPRPTTARIVQLLWYWNRLDDAIPVLNRARMLMPGDPGLLLTRGLVLLAVCRTEEALADFEPVLAGAPSYAAALRGRGLVLVQLDRLREARDALLAAVRLAPNDPLGAGRTSPCQPGPG